VRLFVTACKISLFQLIQPEGDADYSKRWGIIKKISLNPGLNRVAQKSVFLSQNNAIIVVAYGNDAFGSIP
jgi:hypothetical protein